MKKSLLLLFLVCITVQLYAQSSSITIISNDLRTYSKTATGDEQAWPIVTSLANYSSDKNEFVLTDKVQKQLQQFKSQHKAIQQNRVSYAELLKKGARVFAADESSLFESLSKQYQIAIKNGDYSESMKLGISLKKQFTIVETTTNTNREEYVSAILAEKTGFVFKREGILSSWATSSKGDLYKESDGVKTGFESFAKLDFADGSFVMVNPETIALIKRSSIDKLSNASETEVQITSGGLIASLSAKSKQQSNFIVKAAETETIVKSSKFWAKKDDKDVVSFSNYDGDAVVKAGSKAVALKKDEGTIVVKGKEPILPVKLLPSPKLTWAGSDSITFDPSIQLHWNRIPNALYYEIDTSPSSDFSYGILTFTSKVNSIDLKGLEEGTSYIRLRAYDALGLRGTDSPNYRILKNRDDQAPAIFFKNGNELFYFTKLNEYSLDGITEPGSIVTVNNVPIEVKATGEFSYKLILQTNQTDVLVKAVDRSNNKTSVKKTIVKMTSEQLFDLTWSVPSTESTIKKAEKITVSGKAYEPILVEAQLGGKVFKVECGATWNWALQLIGSDANEVIIRFKDKKTGELIAEKRFEIN